MQDENIKMKNYSLKSKFLHFACLAVGGIFAFSIYPNTAKAND